MFLCLYYMIFKDSLNSTQKHYKHFLLEQRMGYGTVPRNIPRSGFEPTSSIDFMDGITEEQLLEDILPNVNKIQNLVKMLSNEDLLFPVKFQRQKDNLFDEQMILIAQCKEIDFQSLLKKKKKKKEKKGKKEMSWCDCESARKAMSLHQFIDR